MDFRLLGPLEARQDGAALALGGPRQRAVLAALALRANEVVSVRSLVEAVWETPPASVDTNIRTYVAGLRRVLRDSGEGAGRLLTRPSGYLFKAEPGELDVTVFGDLAGRAVQALAREDFDAAVEGFQQALDLWRGDPLADLEPGPGLRAEVARLRELRLTMAEQHAEALVGAGRSADAVVELRLLITQNQLREDLWAQLISALYRTGRCAEALEAYEQARRLLADELGIDPGPPLQQLQQQILTSAPVSPGATDTAVSRTVPRQLPAAPRLFRGHAGELTALTDVLDKVPGLGGTVVISAISGAGGIGKTWLALHWAHQHLDRFPDGQLFVDLRGFGPKEKPLSPETVIRWFLHGLGVEQGRIPVDFDVSVGLYRSRMAGRRMLVMLDNAYDLDQVVPLLPGSSTCTVLVTSRDRLTGLLSAHGAHMVAMDVLSETEARELLASRLGVKRLAAEPDAVDDLLAYCDGLPLALSIIAGRAGTHPKFPLRELAAELRDATVRLAALDEGDVSTSLPSVLSWSYAALAPEQAEMFGLMGLAPGTEISLRAAASLAALPTARAHAVLRVLERVSLVYQTTPGRWRMHDLVRLYATDRAHNDLSPEVRDAAVKRLVAFYLHTAHRGDQVLNQDPQPMRLPLPLPGCKPLALADESAALEWFDAEHHCLLASQQLAFVRGWHREVWQLALALDTFHLRRGHLRDDLAAWQAALAAADHLDDPASQSLAHRHLGVAYADIGQHTEGVEHFRRALALAEQACDVTGQARTHHTLAWAWGRQGEYRPALDHATRALHLFRTLHNPVREARVLNQVGWYSAQLGEHTRARAACEAALELHRRHHDREGEAHTLDSLGYVAHHTSRLAQALSYYRQALGLYRGLGHAYSEADTLHRLGHTYHALGQHDQAQTAWQQALELYQVQQRTNEVDCIQLKQRAGAQ